MGSTTASGAPTPPAPEPTTHNTRFFGVYPVDPDRAGRDFGKIAQEILPHLQTPEGAQLRITVEIEAVNAEGYPDDKARVVTENARTLKFEQYGFEDN